MDPGSFIGRDSVNLRLRNMASLARPQIHINLQHSSGSHGQYVSSYSTLDKIEGTVTVVSKNDVKFDDIEITFNGTTKTFVDRLGTSPAASGRSNATHKFLKIEQPIDETTLPHPRVFEAGRPYTFPFTFVVPEQLLPRPCPHSIENDHVHQSHHQMPPSLGDPELAGFGGKLLDDLAPEMVKISYAITACITKIREIDGKNVPVAEGSKKIRIKPAFPEQPPINISATDSQYSTRQEKGIRKGLLSGKLGRLVMESAQPKSFHLPARTGPGDDVMQPVTTSAVVNLRFDPADESLSPPRLDSLSSKLKATTYFATVGQRSFPRKEMTLVDSARGLYSTIMPLASRCVESVQWQKHAGEPKPDSSMQRRDSGVSISGQPAPSSAYRGGTFYTASVLVPLTLPLDKHIVPTFHSCLASRVYGLSLSLSVQGGAVGGSSLTLKVPVQVSSAASAAAEERRASRAEEHEVLIGFRPRNIAPPPEAYIGGSASIAGLSAHPPEYESFNGATPGAATRHAGLQVCG